MLVINPFDRVLVVHDQPQDFKDYLESKLDCRISWASDPKSLRERLHADNPEIIFSIKHSAFPGEYHREAFQSPGLQWFHVGGSGTEHLGSWDSQRKLVTNSAGVLAPFHAERALAALLSMSTGTLKLHRQQLAGHWKPSRFVSLKGKTALILGLGHTGLELARLLKALGMKVIGIRRRLGPVPEFVDEVHRLNSLNSLVQRAHVLSINLRLTPETAGLINGPMLEQLPLGAYVLNGARGELLDPGGLLKHLNSGHLNGAWLDTTWPEPLPEDSPFWSHPKVLVTPHCADQVADFPLRFAEHFVSNYEKLKNGLQPANLVKPEAQNLGG